MRILITGISGLLGQEVERQLSSRGNLEILGLNREPQKRKEATAYIQGDILDYTTLLKAFEGVDAVIHVAAKVSFSRKEKAELFQINVEGTANVVNACLEKGVKRLIHVSSVAAIGRPDQRSGKSNQTIRLNESTKWADSPENSAYAESKFLGEVEVWRGQAEGLSTAIINPSVILGEGNWTESSTQLFRYVFKKNKFYTAGFVNYVDVQDVAKAICTLLDSDIESTRYILNAGQISYADFFGKIAQQFAVPAPRWKLGKTAIEVLWRFEALRGLLTGSKPLITKETALAAQSNFLFENRKIREQLNFEFTPIDETISRVCNYLQKAHA
ncbi:NAD-dependent epimerase/dehydratase family protein [Marinilongibacter aquaticus]|uniref:NAD-dependent epimerase/dehydratase family protein n=1 Tax=Marinilongibacter aquaticus TaxID=2975157 RepID=UPI0021BD1B55|nr:NAD-dependent epimerase/dehydratase family protein [Marinilongibacter aquaticus]UBM57776.1 NAD-dependent epimerase/dehydratase family protein [Marinilongibacter aquaticus]